MKTTTHTDAASWTIACALFAAADCYRKYAAEAGNVRIEKQFEDQAREADRFAALFEQSDGFVLSAPDDAERIIYKGQIVGNGDWIVTVRSIDAAGDLETARPLDLRLGLACHSPTGFAWGYVGSGPAQLALALLADALDDDDRAVKLYQRYHSRHVGHWPQDKGWQKTKAEIVAEVVALEADQKVVTAHQAPNWQAIFQSMNGPADRPWLDYCREPVSDPAKAEPLMHALSARTGLPIRVKVENWNSGKEKLVRFGDWPDLAA